MKKIVNKENFLYLTIILIYFIWFYISNYNVNTVNNSDESYFLNCFHRIYLGQIPYKDFNWVYGPIMLYFFGGLFKIFSVSAITARIGYIILYFAVVVLTYFLAQKIMPRFFAFISAILLIGILKVFCAMYTHIGCTLAGLLILLFILKYFETNKYKYLFLAGIFCGFSLTVKPSTGLGMLVSVCVFFIFNYVLDSIVNKKKMMLFDKNLVKQILIYAGFAIFFSAAIYFFFLKSLTPEQLRMAFPWSSMYRYSITIDNSSLLPIGFTITAFRQWFANETIIPFLIRFLPICSIIIILYGLYFKKFTNIERNILLLTLFMLSISAENFVYFGKTHPSQPVIFIIFTYFLFLVRKSLKNRILVCFFWCIFGIFLSIYIYTYSVIPVIKKNIMFGKYINLKRAHLYVPDNNSYYNFINIVKYIQDNTCPGDRIFALPVDPFIYFYSERQNATITDTAEYCTITTEKDEKMLIDELKKYKPKFIIISNTIIVNENIGMIWGQTYEKNIKKYIDDNYHFKVQFGDFKAKNNRELQENYSCKIYETNKK